MFVQNNTQSNEIQPLDVINTTTFNEKKNPFLLFYHNTYISIHIRYVTFYLVLCLSQTQNTSGHTKRLWQLFLRSNNSETNECLCSRYYW